MSTITVEAVTREHWDGLEALFGPRGASGGGWCMLWRGSRKDRDAGKGEGNRRALKAVVESAAPCGILAHDGDGSVGWCSIAPRSDFPGLERARILQPVDDRPVRSVTCFFVARGYRRRRLSVALLTAVCDYARARGAEIVEGYPVAPTKPSYPAVYAWTGRKAAFDVAGFEVRARRSETRPIMRQQIA